MSDLQDRVNYHAIRAIEELECAECARIDAERRPHMELSRLHLTQAGQLRMSDPDSSAVMAISSALVMGEASREQGFQQYGCC